jgi:tetratricopeptide (TPR) repeat protein
MSSRVLLSGLALCAIAGAALAAVENHGTKLGIRYLKEGDYARAERIFEQVLNQDPKDMKAWEGYRTAFQKRKAAEEGGAGEEEASSAPRDEEPAPRKKPKAKPRREEDESSDAASEQKSDEVSRKDIGRVDPGMLRNKRRAKERFESLRTELSQTYRRQHSGAVEINCTYYTPQLYRYLIENLGSQRGYTVEKAQKLYEVSVRDMRNQLEFYLKLNNYSSKPKLTVPIGEMVKKISLVDDDGNSYEPARWKGPKNPDLVGEDALTVWFNRTDSDGEDIIKKAGKGNVYIVVSDLAHEQKQIQLQYKAARLTGDAQGKASGSRSLMDRMKDLWR